VLSGELPAAGRGAGLVEYRRALRRRFAEVDSAKLKIGAAVGYAMDPVGVGKFSPYPIPQHCSILPAVLPELIDRLHIVLGDLVTLVVAFLPMPRAALSR
jgi:hypothetical protein